MRLRWVIRDGEKILQYEHDEISFIKETKYDEGSSVGIVYEKAIYNYSWKDVEIVTEKNLGE
jgi:hypothetical protein